MQVEGVSPGGAKASPDPGDAPDLGSWSHLARRFFDVLTARPLDPEESSWVAERLSPGELALFTAQSPADQRHGYETGVAVAACGDSELVRAALVHDVGKARSGLGVAGRVAASVAVRLHLPLRGRFAAYRDHDLLGAADLAAAGSPPRVVEHAATHHGRPGTGALAAEDRRILAAADDGMTARRRRLR